MNRLVAVLFLLIASVAVTAHAGPLTPPGAPAPTMVTLDQLNTAIGAADASADAAAAEAIDAQDKRIDILTLPGDAQNTHIISAPGSYFLSGNVTGESGKNGIRFLTSQATIDLNGYSVVGVAGSLDGIRADGSVSNAFLVVKNGLVMGWGSDGLATNSVGFFADGTIENVEFVGNGGAGTNVPFSARWRVNNSSARGNSVAGFSFGSAQVSFSNCQASSNTGNGFTSSNGSTFLNCSARSNTSAGFSASSATLVSCVSTGNTGNGFSLFSSHITNSNAVGNGLDGIFIGASCLVKNCNAQGNGLSGVGAGIHASNSDNRIEGNNVLSNDNGIDCDASGNVVIGNSASGNTDDYGQVLAGNHLGTVVTTPAAMNAATNNFVNVSY